MKNSNRKSAFTLIELMVVISVITLMSTIVTVALNGSRQRGEQSAFIQSLHQFQVALETYKTNNGFYPAEGDWAMDSQSQQSGSYNSSGGTFAFTCAGGYTSTYGWWVPYGVDWDTGQCSTGDLDSFFSYPISIISPQPTAWFNWSYVDQPALVPKYIKKSPVPPGKSGNMLAYINVPLPFGINQLEIDNASYNSPNPAFYCGGKKPQGYFIYFFDNENFTAGTPSNYPLPRITMSPSYLGGWSGNLYGYEYCLTAS